MWRHASHSLWRDAYRETRDLGSLIFLKLQWANGLMTIGKTGACAQTRIIFLASLFKNLYVQQVLINADFQTIKSSANIKWVITAKNFKNIMIRPAGKKTQCIFQLKAMIKDDSTSSYEIFQEKISQWNEQNQKINLFRDKTIEQRFPVSDSKPTVVYLRDICQSLKWIYNGVIIYVLRCKHNYVSDFNHISFFCTK